MSRLRGNRSKFIRNILAIGSLILGAISIFATYNVYFLQRPNKQLQVTAESSVSLIDVNPQVANDIEILYKGEQVNNLVFLQLRVENTGNQPILENDYSRNISVSFPQEYKIVEVKIVSSNPSNIGAELNTTMQNKIEIKPVLLNSGDAFVIRFVLITPERKSINYQIDGRIIGLREIKRVDLPNATPMTERERLELLFNKSLSEENWMLRITILLSMMAVIVLMWDREIARFLARIMGTKKESNAADVKNSR